ncbi:MAG: Rne/Rng family ribonuclease, partial [Rhodoferax sp.]|nr:Rne/Rng family ribonuclease [Rhodoferax sp.]
NVYLGKVARVLPGMQSAFIDMGLERAAFLHVADVWQRQPEGEPPQTARSALPLVPIEKQVFEGQSLMVQVVKDPIGSKGARLSTQISIAGRHLVFLPQDDHIGVSQKIPTEQRDALRERLKSIVGAQGGGFILRTNAEDSSDAELSEDISYLRKTWACIKEASLRLPAQSMLHQDLTLLQRVLRDLVAESTQTIRIDSKEQFEKLMVFATEFMPAAAQRLQLYKGERPIFDLYSIAKALGRRVDLKSGGYLIIDQTEALTTVDVNTGGYVGARNFDDTVFKTNLEAAHAIARQLRLRNLGGIIIVDFIDMSRAEHQEAVLAEFRKQLSRDRVKTMAGGFSQLGLLEMTRKRTRESLSQGNVKTTRTVVYDILREILREARQFNPREFRVVAAPGVIEMLLDEESQHLAALSDFIAKPVSLQSEAAM